MTMKEVMEWWQIAAGSNIYSYLVAAAGALHLQKPTACLTRLHVMNSRMRKRKYGER